MRNVLRQALHGSDVYNRVVTASSFGEALRDVNGMSHNIDVVFVSAVFGDLNAQAFFGSLKKVKAAKGAAFILVFRGDESFASTLANNLIAGADGFLIAPFSVQGVSETSAIAAMVKRRNADHRLAAASGVVVESMLNEIDKRAAQKAAGKEPKKISKNLLEANAQFKAVAGESMSTFYETVEDRTSKRNPLKPSDESGYQGASERVRKKLTEKDDDAV